MDTHTFLWMALDDPQLSPTARSLVENADNTRWLSVASIWEIAIKVKLGKLEINQPLPVFVSEQLARNEITLLPIHVEHAVFVSSLPFARFANGSEHKDPFDRLIVAQSKLTALPVLGSDIIFDQYGVTRIW